MLELTCKRCSKVISVDWRKDRQTIRTRKLEFCSRSCANARYQLGDANIKRLQTFEKRRALRPAKLILHVNNTCTHCNAIFTTARNRKRKTCSKECRVIINSMCRQAYIKRYGTFSTLRETFTYKNTTIEVDSQLEKAAVVYMIDTLNAIKIERYHNLINYKDNSSHRTFNPDFICYISNKTHIVEVKQLWSGNQEHAYTKNIPLKREALNNFCKLKNYNMIWLDFNEAPSMKKIYLDILKQNKINKSGFVNR